MASIQTQTSFPVGGYGHARDDIKIHSKATVKPVLKKLRQSAKHSSDKRASLDLNRGWDEQVTDSASFGFLDSQYSLGQGLGLQNNDDGRKGAGIGNSDLTFDSLADLSTNGTVEGRRSAKDVSFAFSAKRRHKRKRPSKEDTKERRRSGGSADARGAFTATASPSNNLSSGAFPPASSIHYNHKHHYYAAAETPRDGVETPLTPSTSVPMMPLHNRSTSGASHSSSITTNSGRNGGSFVHPFQQTPRTSSPSLSYTNSLTASDQFVYLRASHTTSSRGVHPPSISEADADNQSYFAGNNSKVHKTSLSDLKKSNAKPWSPMSWHHHSPPSQLSQHQSQPTASVQNTTSPATTITSASQASEFPFHSPPLSTADTTPALTNLSGTASSSLNAASSAGCPLADTLPAGEGSHCGDSMACPATSLAASAKQQTYHRKSHSGGGHHNTRHSRTSSSASITSPLRTSLDMAGFRLRSRSEVDTATRQEQIREARRRFDEKERAKDEEHVRKQMKRRDKEADKAAAKVLGTDRHSSGTRRSATFTSTSRRSVSLDYQPHDGVSKSTSFASERRPNLRPGTEKTSAADDHSPSAPASRAEGVHFEGPSKKRKTASNWAAFMLWIRAKMFKASKR